MKKLIILIALSGCTTGTIINPPPPPPPKECVSAGPVVEHSEKEYVVSLQANTGKYVTAECGGDDVGLVTVNRDVDSEWETFYVLPLGDDQVSVRSSHGRYLSAEEGGGKNLSANRKVQSIWESFKLYGELKDQGSISLGTNDGVHFVSAINTGVVTAGGAALGVWEQFKLRVSYAPIPPVKIRPGVVHANGSNFADGEGTFYPLGQTLFWALRGWKFEKERVKQNLIFLGKHHYDYIRILGEVGWDGMEINPSWPDYEQNLAEFIDFAYDKCGLRVEFTIIGGGYESEAMSIAQKVVRVVKAGREHKIMNFEVANESFGRRISLEEMRSVGRYLRQNLPNHLVAISSGEGVPWYMTPTADFRSDFEKVFMQAGTANLGTIHMDRSQSDGGWRETRQPWDWKDRPYPISHNEPIGPRSSIAEEVDPIRLAMLRATGIINGVEAFVLHNATGVAGVIDAGHNRPANLWEVPGIDAIMDAVRNVDTFLPPRVGNGQHYNNSWGGNPWTTDSFWTDGADHGVNRNYTVATADGWVSVENGVKNYAVFTARNKSLVEVYDVLLGKVKEINMEAGQTITLTPLSKDSNGYGAFIIVGHYR